MRGESQPDVPDHRCGIGSVKSNIGHLELAAGISGLIKVLLQMKHKTLVKSLHCETLNPYLQLTDSPFYIVQEKQEWKSVTDRDGNELPRRAGISSFGIGGVNAHIVIEEYMPKANSEHTATEQPNVIVLSAKNKSRLIDRASQLLEVIRNKNILIRICTASLTPCRSGAKKWMSVWRVLRGQCRSLKRNCRRLLTVRKKQTNFSGDSLIEIKRPRLFLQQMKIWRWHLMLGSEKENTPNLLIYGSKGSQSSGTHYTERPNRA